MGSRLDPSECILVDFPYSVSLYYLFEIHQSPLVIRLALCLSLSMTPIATSPYPVAVYPFLGLLTTDSLAP